MRSLITLVLFSFFYIVLCKSNVKTLSDSNEQEVIEIGGPKELPPGLEEEPSAESEDEDLKATGTTAAKKDSKKTTTLSDGRKRIKDTEKIDGISPEDEEARLEKELAEIYKDTDYKDNVEETEVTKETTTGTSGNDISEETKPIGRSKNGFKFAPDSTNKKDVARFRTSIDDINCKNRQMLSGNSPSHPTSDSNGSSFISTTYLMTTLVLCSTAIIKTLYF